MGSHRAHILLPDDLIEEIDSVVGPRGRSAFLVETARAELRRRRLLAFLREVQPTWQDKDHPELVSGALPWIRTLRQRSERRPAQSASPAVKRPK